MPFPWLEIIVTVVTYIIMIAVTYYFSNRHPSAYVEINNKSDSVRVLGNTAEIAIMMEACVLSLEEKGCDMTQLRSAIVSMEKDVIINMKKEHGDEEDD